MEGSSDVVTLPYRILYTKADLTVYEKKGWDESP